LDQKQLQRFVDVAESGSLSRTSKRLYISQPALSKSLRLLEEQLGVRLLERGPRGVKLTKFGEAFYKRARSVTSELRRANDDLNHIKGLFTGCVSLGVTPGPGILDQIIPKAIVRIALKRPDLKFKVRSGAISELLVDLHRGDLDLLFTLLDERTKGPDLKTQKLFDDSFALVVRTGHKLLSQKEISLNDLIENRWVMLEDALPLWDGVVDLARQNQIQATKGPIESNSLVFIREVVRKTDFIGIIPAYAAEISTASGNLRYIPLERISRHDLLPTLTRSLGLVHSAEIELTQTAEALLRSINTVCIELNLIGKAPRVITNTNG
jgi:DNA-binding transcriptional LysR family regulator